MSGTVVTEYSGSSTRSPEHISMDAEHMRIVLIKKDGGTKELFKGKEFRRRIFQKNMKTYNYRSHLDGIRKKDDGTYELQI